MNGKRGFTLIELLVVIAIITILAGIVVPRVAQYMQRSRAARAQSEINGITMSLTAMLADSGKSSFMHFFEANGQYTARLKGSVTEIEEFYQDVFYRLLRQGRNIDSAFVDTHRLDKNVVRKLGATYMDLSTDPWGELYHFWIGPWNKTKVADAINAPQNEPTEIYFRIYKAETNVPGGPKEDVYTVNEGETEDEEALQFVPFGYPAPKDLPVYVYSTGSDVMAAQAFYQDDGSRTATLAYKVPATDEGPVEKAMGGGDDINNWDSGASWAPFYQ